MQFIPLTLQLMQMKKYINIYLYGTVKGGQLYSSFMLLSSTPYQNTLQQPFQ